MDLVLTTHAHWDHFDPVTYEEYVIPDTIVGPGTCMAALEKSGLAIPGVRLDRGETLERCGFRITATTADHDVDSVGIWFPVTASSSISAETRFFTTKTMCQMSVWRRMCGVYLYQWKAWQYELYGGRVLLPDPWRKGRRPRRTMT